MRRNLKMVPVVDDDGNELYAIPRQDAVEHIKNGVAFSVFNRAIRFLKCGPRSTSEHLSGALNTSDMEALAGARTMSSERRARIAECGGAR